ncbi:MAG: EAL domain-containing response regulator, partial [Candidatus Omnitrophica bacterium]|nr:EAL domain-containing response regulator [Candidatus Omnitrophota bacterium]
EGLDVCRQIREDKRYRGIPIMIVSGRDSSTDKIEGLYVGADDYLTKPFETEELIARIKALLRRMEFNRVLEDERHRLVSDLKIIIDEEKITPYFQPIFDFKTAEIIGYEAFGRPPLDCTLNNPEVLFNTALACGLYFDLEKICWTRSFNQWLEECRQGRLFLNCSPYMIESGKFSINFFEAYQDSHLPITLEITERIGIQNYHEFIRKLNMIREKGIQVAIDDVGCGFASLNTVAEIQPEYIKIDMPLVRNIFQDPLKQSIVRAIVHLAKEGGMKTVAEGIEIRSELDFLLTLGVDSGQGYLLSRPKPAFETKNIKGLL